MSEAFYFSPVFQTHLYNYFAHNNLCKSIDLDIDYPYYSALIANVHNLIEINSLENALLSTIYLLLLYHIIGALHTNRTNPVCDLQFLFLSPWIVSTNPSDLTSLPLGAFIILGIIYYASQILP